MDQKAKIISVGRIKTGRREGMLFRQGGWISFVPHRVAVGILQLLLRAMRIMAVNRKQLACKDFAEENPLSPALAHLLGEEGE